MKLIKCNIENFGTLSNFHYKFNEKINVINKDNGFGKSTLCAFIKAMFYGFNNTKSKDLSENERKKFTPWQGGVFGGSLEFMCDKGEYKIERTFGLKASLDTFLLIDLKSGKKSEDFSENLGEELFGIDLKGFERCTLVNHDFSGGKLPLCVSSRLSQMVDNTDDLNNYDTAFSALLKRSRQYKTTGNRGIIYDLERVIADSQNKAEQSTRALEQLEAVSETKSKAEQRKKLIEKELENTRSLISENSGVEVVRQKIKHYNSLVANSKSSKERIDNIEQKYNGKIPTESQINSLNVKIERLNKLRDGNNNEITHIKRVRLFHSILSSIAWISASVLFLLDVLLESLTNTFLLVGFFVVIIGIILEITFFINKKRSDKSVKKETAELTDLLTSELQDLGIETADKDYSEILSELKSDFNEYIIEQAKFEDYFSSAKQYFKQENLKSVKQDIQSKTPEELKKKERELTEQYDIISAEILKLSSQEDKIREISELYTEAVYHKETAMQKLAVANENYNALITGMQLLSKAKQNLTSRYKQKIEENFKKYLSEFTDGNLSDILLSDDFEISVFDNGFSREPASYSSGVNSVIEISLRLSLLNSLFEKEKGFIIFDDSFAFLDDKTFSKMSEKLKNISENTQILYFTCSKSRTF